MQVLLTIGFEGTRDALERALVETSSSLVESDYARCAAVNVRVAGDEWERLKDFNVEHDAFAMVKLWDPAADAVVKFSLPDGAWLVGAYRCDEVVQKNYERTWPSGTASPGVKLVCLVRRKPEISHQQYLDHWRNDHGPLAVRMQPGFWHYVQNHVSDWLTDVTPDFDGIGELHFETVDDVFTGMFADEDAQRLIYEDIERFLVNKTSTVLVTTETLVGF
jgi:hypothetical protein